MTCEAIIKSTGTRGIQHFLQSLVEEIAQRNVAIMVQATGNYCTIHEYANLVAQGIAEDLLCLNGLTLLVWPLKDVVVLQIYIIRHLPSIIAFRPWTRHIL
jgi:hypothetical protein